MVQRHSSEAAAPRHSIRGRAHLLRAGDWPFRHQELWAGAEVVARIGRGGFLRTYFGRGRRVQLADGSRWRLAAISRARWICPAIFNEAGQRVAVSGPLDDSTYGISTKHDGYTLIPVGASTWRRRTGRWRLELHDKTVAALSHRPLAVDAYEAVPTAVVLVAFTLIELGMPGESELGIPGFRWEAR